MNRSLTDTELSKVCEVIADKLGLSFPVERWAILGRNLAIAAREAGFQEMDKFVHSILSHRLSKFQIKMLASHLTTTETYFWREPEVFKALTGDILPEIIKLKRDYEKSISIWSSGCSTGEEAYSLAIAVHNSIPDISRWKINILATDINQKALDKAAEGIYGPWSFRNTPEWLLKKYFNKLEDRKYEIIREIRKMVTFSNLNLAQDKYFLPSDGTKLKDIIFCRNVLMYFTEEWVDRIYRNFFNSLSDNGWFVVSSAELSPNLSPLFTSVNFPGAIFYRKNGNGAKTLPQDRLITSDNLHEEKTPLSIQSTAALLNPSTIEPIVQGEPADETPAEPQPTKIFAIHLLASQGYLPEALSLCNEAIGTDKLTPGLYFLRASILQEMDRYPEAIASLKQAIYLDSDYIMGHFALGNLFIREGNEKSAKRHFNTVLGLLTNYSNDDILTDSDGLSVKYIREIILANIEVIRTK